MTDPTAPSRGRIDLRSIDVHGGAADRVIAGAMEQIRLDPLRAEPDTFGNVDRYLRPALVAAAVLAALAAGVVASSSRRPSYDTPAIATLASWVETQHVPTNGELLVAFKGYR
jgi:hypothetical protein